MSKILLITYLFPPFGGVGVHRILSLAKYLPQNGDEVYVLTASNPSAVGTDSNLLAQVPKTVSITRTRTIDLPFRLKKALKRVLNRCNEPKPVEGTNSEAQNSFVHWCKDRLTPDPQILWVSGATRAGLRLVSKYGIDTVLVSAPPYSSFLIGNAIKRRFPRLKYVTDFRDEWLSSFNIMSYNQSSFARGKATQIERATIELSNLVVAATDAARREIENRYPEQVEEAKFQTITNGFDPSAFETFESRRHLSNKTLLTYVGTISNYAAPISLIAAFEGLPAEIRSSMRLQVIGYIENPVHRRLLEGAPDFVELNGFLPHSEAIKRMEETDYLLLITDDELNIPAKFYDYLGTGKPILALARPQSEVWRVLQETRAGWCADVSDVLQVRSLLVEAHRRKELLPAEHSPDLEIVQNYVRPRLARQYSELINQSSI